MSETTSSSQDIFRVLISPQTIRKYNILDGRWDPFLSDFLSMVSRKVNSNSCFDILEVDNGIRSPLIQYFQSFENLDTPCSALVMRGSVGIGKSSFIEWWMSQKDRRSVCTKIDINMEGMRFSSQHNLHDYAILEFVQMKIAKDLLSKHIMKTNFSTSLDRCILRIQGECAAESDNDFKRGFINQSEDFRKKYPDTDPSILLACVIFSANESIKKPICMFIDNIDLERKEIQEIFIRSAYKILNDIRENSLKRGWDTKCHLILTVRPETMVYWHNFCAQYQSVDYPLPNVLNIARNKVFQAMNEVAQEMPLVGLSIGGKDFQNTKQLCEHIQECIEVCLETWPTRWGDIIVWHNALVNYNVRRFVKAWVNFLLSGNFLNVWTFQEEEGVPGTPSPYRYLRMLIRGPYAEFIGNDRIDGMGESTDSPLVFNVFGLPYSADMDVLKYRRNYFIYLRIMQYLVSHGDKSFSRITEDLQDFFNEDVIEKAIKRLLWVRLVDEINIGIRNIGGSGGWEDIPVPKDAVITKSDTTNFYINSLITEYEYISSMAMVSYHISQSEIRFSGNDPKHLQYAKAAYIFLSSHREILRANLMEYERKKKLEKFKTLFISAFHHVRPWKGMIDGTIEAIKRQQRYYSSLAPITSELCALREKGQREYASYVGNIW